MLLAPFAVFPERVVGWVVPNVVRPKGGEVPAGPETGACDETPNLRFSLRIPEHDFPDGFSTVLVGRPGLGLPSPWFPSHAWYFNVYFICISYIEGLSF